MLNIVFVLCVMLTSLSLLFPLISNMPTLQAQFLEYSVAVFSASNAGFLIQAKWQSESSHCICRPEYSCLGHIRRTMDIKILFGWCFYRLVQLSPSVEYMYCVTKKCEFLKRQCLAIYMMSLGCSKWAFSYTFIWLNRILWLRSLKSCRYIRRTKLDICVGAGKMEVMLNT